MILSLEMNLKKPKQTNASTDIFWLSKMLDNTTTTTETPLCDPHDSNCLLQNNYSLDDPYLTLSNDSYPGIWEMMGDPQDPYAIPMTIIYTIIFLTGMIGNICTCIVISRNRYMHTATNYYLFSLAISDLLLLILGLPQDITILWARYPYPFGEVFCILRGWFSEASTNASILTITAFTVERYLAICHPLKAHTMSRLSRAIKFIFAIWICSGLAAITMGYQLGVVYEKDARGEDILETAVCNVDQDRELKNSFEWSLALFFVFPATLLCILYLLIGLQLKRSTEMGRKHDGRPNAVNLNGSSKMQGKVLNSQGRSVNRKSSSASRKDVIKMLVAVVVAFFVCWTPFHAQRLMAAYITEPTEADRILYNFVTNVSGVCYYVSATINPILYSILSLKFRHAFRDTLGRCLGRGGAGRRRGRTLSLFNSTLKSGLEMTEDFTIVSEMPSGGGGGGNHLNGGRKVSRMVMVKGPTKDHSDSFSSLCPHKKTSTTVSNASLEMADAFDDATISDYIDQMKETQA